MLACVCLFSCPKLFALWVQRHLCVCMMSESVFLCSVTPCSTAITVVSQGWPTQWHQVQQPTHYTTTFWPADHISGLWPYSFNNASFWQQAWELVTFPVFRGSATGHQLVFQRKQNTKAKPAKVKVNSFSNVFWNGRFGAEILQIKYIKNTHTETPTPIVTKADAKCWKIRDFSLVVPFVLQHVSLCHLALQSLATKAEWGIQCLHWNSWL